MHLVLSLSLSPLIILSVTAWSWTPSAFRAYSSHVHNKRNLASFKNKFGYKDERQKRDLVHPLMFTRESR